MNTWLFGLACTALILWTGFWWLLLIPVIYYGSIFLTSYAVSRPAKLEVIKEVKPEGDWWGLGNDGFWIVALLGVTAIVLAIASK